MNGERWWYWFIVTPPTLPTGAFRQLTQESDYLMVRGHAAFPPNTPARMTITTPGGKVCQVTDVRTGAHEFSPDTQGVVRVLADIAACARAGGKWYLNFAGGAAAGSIPFWEDTTRCDPWSFPSRIDSPDTRFTVHYHALGEAQGMGSPLTGIVEIEPVGFWPCGRNPGSAQGLFYGPPFWSADSRYVAIPRQGFIGEMMEVFDVLQRKRAIVPQTATVLQILSFDGGRIEGVDRPHLQPSQYSASIEGLGWGEWDDG